MAFINKDSLVLIEGKITNIGRQQLAYGTLSFNKFAVGDSEIDYQFSEKYSLQSVNQQVLRPVDSQPNIRYPILTSNTSTEYLAPIPIIIANERQIRNKANERGFFTRTVISAPNVTPIVYSPYAVNTNLTSGTTHIDAIVDTLNITIDNPTGIVAGSMVMIQWFTNTATNTNATDADNIGATNPSAWLWYMAVDIEGKRLTLDRAIPKTQGSLAGNVYVYPPLGQQITHFENGVTNPFWDNETLTFNNPASTNTSDVPVWNLSIVYGDSVIGATPLLRAGYYPSAAYEGFRNYTGVTNVSKPLGILHYTNHSNNNYYGEGFFNNTLVIELPTVMYHNSVSAYLGLTLTTDSVKKSLISETSTSTNFSLIYYDLIGPDLKVVGKVFSDLKVVTIEDSEILAVMSHVSNRNWTLPAFNQFSINATSNNQDSPNTNPNSTFMEAIPNNIGVANADSTIYVTYKLSNDSADSGLNGYRNSMICQNYRIAKGAGISGIQLSFSGPDFKFLKTPSDGHGYSATDLTILFQIVGPNQTLEYDKWVPMAFNSHIGTDGIAPITAAMLSQKIWSISADEIKSAQTNALTNNAYYKISYLNTEHPALNFGSEELFFGNVKTDIKALAFATTFRFQLDVGSYDKSTNPTWNPTLPIYITEVGIYDNNNYLVVSGKLNYPIKKGSDEIVLISLDMDF